MSGRSSPNSYGWPIPYFQENSLHILVSAIKNKNKTQNNIASTGSILATPQKTWSTPPLNTHRSLRIQAWQTDLHYFLQNPLMMQKLLLLLWYKNIYINETNMKGHPLKQNYHCSEWMWYWLVIRLRHWRKRIWYDGPGIKSRICCFSISL